MQQPIAKSERKFEYLYTTMVDVENVRDLRVNKMSDLLLSKYDDQMKLHMNLLKTGKKKENLFSLLNIITTSARDIIVYTYAVF